MPDIFVNGQDDVGDNKPKEFSMSEDESAQKESEVSQPKLTNAEKHARIRDENANKKPTSVLSSYFFYPEKVEFVNKDPEEVVILLLRKHPITNIPWISMAFVMIMVPGFISILPFFEALPSRLQLVLAIVWYMITMAFVLEKFLTWFFHVNIVTDERIIEVDFENLLYREITDANLDQIQDVTPRVSGAIRTFFNYGDVQIQTSAAIPLITFEAVKNPDNVGTILRKLRVEEEEEKLEGKVR